MPSTYIISVDIGSTKMRSCVFDAKCQLCYSTETEVETISFEERNTTRSEIEPEVMWESFQKILASAVDFVKRQRATKASLALCVQRNTFVTWNKETLEPCHRLITWKDGRGRNVTYEWNDSILRKLLNAGGRLAHFFTRVERFKAAAIFRAINAMVTHRFLVTLDENDDMKKLLAADKLAVGCLETWLIARLTKNKVHVTDPSNASSTGLYDPFQNDWGYLLLKILGFPTSVLPQLVDTAGMSIGTVDGSMFGIPMSIDAVTADAQIAALGCGCTKPGQMKISLGTGTFLDMITGPQPYASMRGIYPLVGWSVHEETTFVVEGCSHDTAPVVHWALSVGLMDTVEESSDVALRATPQSGLHFIPAFNGVQTPIDDDTACCGFLGIRPTTSKPQMLRAVFESLAFRVYQIAEAMREEIGMQSGVAIRICGGVARNDFICQQIANLLRQPVERVEDYDFASAKGAALLAGVTEGLWSMDSLTDFVSVERTFVPDEAEGERLLREYKQWLKALRACLKYYE
ncbi:FGGY family of carbohydrate kinasesN-terminal domain containing protein [Aphelenchoides avenae]|nr:FGGY family of carbohydrate kinasesN-terminal domain containing protein [Aphelenchus avenae]